MPNDIILLTAICEMHIHYISTYYISRSLYRV